MSDQAEYEGDIIEPPRTSSPPVPHNPFAVAAPEHLSAGAVAIESQRGVAEVQGRMLIAKRFPRDSALAYQRTMTSCLRIGLATEALYKFPRAGGAVEGPSIRLAEEMARSWGNVEYGLNELSRRSGESEMEAFAWDLETNTRSSQRFTVRHIRDRTEGGKALDTERDIYEITANMGARRMRSRILAILPPELVRDAIARCKQTMRDGGGEPLEDRIKRMMAAFQPLGVMPQMIIDRLGHSIDRVTPDELVDLAGIYQSLKDGQTKAADWFGRKDPPKDADPFEQAAAGKRPTKKQQDNTFEQAAAGAPTTLVEKPKDEAAEIGDEAAQFISQLAGMSQTEVERLDTNPAHKAWLKKLPKPEYDRVAQAITDRLLARLGA
ncbi:MAG TPA: hypothetical protein VGM38_02505 [Pseudolysinimonas sp.]|jgi:hypothetical protein